MEQVDQLLVADSHGFPVRWIRSYRQIRYVLAKLYEEMYIDDSAPEPLQVGNQVVTQKSLYTALIVIGMCHLARRTLMRDG